MRRNHTPRYQPLTTTPLWIACGQFGIFVILIVGFNVRQQTPPMLANLILFMSVAGTIVFGPIGRARHIVVTASGGAMVVWWMASAWWTYNPVGWRRDSLMQLPIIIAGVALVSLLPRRRVETALVWTVYFTIIYNCFYVVVLPQYSTHHTDGNAGWPGTFGHKQGLSMFMIFAIMVLIAFAPRSPRRRLGIALALFFIVMSQSTTALAVGFTVLIVGWMLKRLSTNDTANKAVTITVGLIVAISGAVLTNQFASTLLATRGKDPTLTRRTELWARVWPAIVDRPWNGYGIGGVWIDPTLEPTSTIERGWGLTVFHAHNGYLEMMLRLGAIGLVIFLILVGSTLAFAFRLLKHRFELARFTILFITLILVMSITETATFDIWLAMVMMLQAMMIADQRASLRTDEYLADPDLDWVPPEMITVGATR